MAYSDFTYYSDTYQGTLNEAAYNRLVLRATAEIDRITSNRAKDAIGETLIAVKNAECAVVDELNFQGKGGSGDVTSESNDGISRSYATGQIAKSSRQRIIAAADTWLYNTDLCAVPV